MRTPQKPIGSGFDFRTTADEVVEGMDLSGKVVIVTGGATGIGLETVRVLNRAGAKIVLAARDPAKAEHLSNLMEGVELARLDLLSPDSIDEFADHFLASGRALHLLVNNAGVMASPLVRDSRGYESQFATNHLGHFQLTVRLWPALFRANGARVVTVSSRGHRFAAVDFDDPNFLRRPYDRWRAYGQSKTANILFAVRLDQLGERANVRALSLHPGRILDTGLSRYLTPEEITAVPIAQKDGRAFTTSEDYIKTSGQGAATSVWCATSPRLEGLGGVYCEDCDIAFTVSDESDGLGVRTYATDVEAADRLWRLSERLTGTSLATIG